MTGTRFHPWRRLRDLGPAWQLKWRDDLPWDVYGFTEWRTRTIHMRQGMTFEERRCTVAHEVEHVLRGPHSTCHRVAEELAVDRRCSRLLLPSMREVADALVFNRGEYELAAEDLWVDPWTLETRLGSLYGLEQGYLKDRMEEAVILGIEE